MTSLLREAATTMPDSWIDKQELDELVEMFAPKKGRKGKAVVKSHPSAKSKKNSVDVDPITPPEVESESDAPPVDVPPASRPVDVPRLPEITFAEETPPEVEDPSIFGETVEAIPAETSPEEAVIIERSAEVKFRLDQEKLVETEAIPSEFPAIPSEKDEIRIESGTAPRRSGSIFTVFELDDIQEEEPEIISHANEETVIEARVSKPRELPHFLGSGDDFASSDPIPPTNRDAGRALSALAAARARADQSGLLHVHHRPGGLAKVADASPREGFSPLPPPLPKREEERRFSAELDPESKASHELEEPTSKEIPTSLPKPWSSSPPSFEETMGLMELIAEPPPLPGEVEEKRPQPVESFSQIVRKQAKIPPPLPLSPGEARQESEGDHLSEATNEEKEREIATTPPIGQVTEDSLHERKPEELNPTFKFEEEAGEDPHEPEPENLPEVAQVEDLLESHTNECPSSEESEEELAEEISSPFEVEGEGEEVDEPELEDALESKTENQRADGEQGDLEYKLPIPPPPLPTQAGEIPEEASPTPLLSASPTESDASESVDESAEGGDALSEIEDVPEDETISHGDDEEHPTDSKPDQPVTAVENVKEEAVASKVLASPLELEDESEDEPSDGSSPESGDVQGDDLDNHSDIEEQIELPSKPRVTPPPLPTGVAASWEEEIPEPSLFIADDEDDEDETEPVLIEPESDGRGESDQALAHDEETTIDLEGIVVSEEVFESPFPSLFDEEKASNETGLFLADIDLSLDWMQIEEFEAAVSLDELAKLNRGEDEEGKEDPDDEAEMELDSPEPTEAATVVAEPTAVEEEPDLSNLYGGALYDRIRYFGESARHQLGAREVLICDQDGLLLYSDLEGGGRATEVATLLLELSGKAAPLFGSEESAATQIATGNGEWKCLIRGVGPAAHLYAAFRLKNPLNMNQIDIWTSALTNAIRPATPHS